MQRGTRVGALSMRRGGDGREGIARRKGGLISVGRRHTSKLVGVVDLTIVGDLAKHQSLIARRT